MSRTNRRRAVLEPSVGLLELLAPMLDSDCGASNTSLMTTHAPRLPFALDPLIAEAKQRARRRRFLVVAVLALVLAGAAAGLIAARSPVGANGKVTALGLPDAAHSCGILGVGIGWHLSASSTLSCSSARTVMRAYFEGASAGRTVLGYACASLQSGGRLRCTSGRTVVTAIANH
jgi:hypothetical protein